MASTVAAAWSRYPRVSLAKRTNDCRLIQMRRVPLVSSGTSWCRIRDMRLVLSFCSHCCMPAYLGRAPYIHEPAVPQHSHPICESYRRGAVGDDNDGSGSSYAGDGGQDV